MTDVQTLACNISSHGQTPRHVRSRAGPWCSPRAWPRPPRRSQGQCQIEPRTEAASPPSASSGPWATWSSRGLTLRQGLQHEWMVLSWAFISLSSGPVSLFKINREGAERGRLIRDRHNLFYCWHFQNELPLNKHRRNAKRLFPLKFWIADLAAGRRNSPITLTLGSAVPDIMGIQLVPDEERSWPSGQHWRGQHSKVWTNRRRKIVVLKC